MCTLRTPGVRIYSTAHYCLDIQCLCSGIVFKFELNQMNFYFVQCFAMSLSGIIDKFLSDLNQVNVFSCIILLPVNTCIFL